MLSDLLCQEVGLPPGASPADLIQRMRVSHIDYFDGLLAGDDAKDAALASLDEMSEFSLRVVPQLGVPQEKYCKIHIDAEAKPVRVALVKDGLSAQLPTDMETLLFWAIIQPGSPLASRWEDVGFGRSLQWREAAKGLAIVAEPMPVKEGVGRTVASLLALQDGTMASVSIPGSIAEMASEIHVGAPIRMLSPVQARLCFEAAVSNHPKWRFLSLYRILENAYLTNIKQILIDAFDKDAGQAVEEAKKKLQSEINQLVDLMSSKQLSVEFENFNQAFDQQIVAQNRYILALDRAAASDALYKTQELAKKGVLRFYKIRCSIAHGGTSSVIYEQAPDAAAAMMSLLPYVEAIALKSLAITLR